MSKKTESRKKKKKIKEKEDSFLDIVKKTSKKEETPLAEIEETKGVEEELPQASELEAQDKAGQRIDFNELIKRVGNALRGPEGKKLNCRLKVLVDDQQAYIYQGLRNNVWGRLFSSKKHLIYRYPLKKLLQEHPDTKDYFTHKHLRN